ncbi:hypothetical protein QL285_059179 [Trifolium repens]|nr:hypothetical protein QL285_059179 [Trifolium repens]
MFELSKSVPNSETESFVTPQEEVIPQTQKTTPPLKTYTKKSKAKIPQTPKPRRSARLESSSVSSRKQAIDKTIYEIMDSDSDEEATPSPPRQTKSISQLVEPLKPTETSKSEPTKPKTSKGAFFANIERFVAENQRKEKENAGKNVEEVEEIAETEGKKKEKKKDQPEEVEPIRPKSRVSSAPLVHPSNKEEFQEFWTVKPVPSCRIYDFDSLLQGGIDVLRLTEIQGWTNLFRLRETVYTQLVQAFYYNAEIDSDNCTIKSNLKGKVVNLDPEELGRILELPTDGEKIFGDGWFSKAKVKRSELMKEIFTPEGATLPQPQNSFLKKEYKVIFNMIQNHIFPRMGTKEKVHDGDMMIMYYLGSGKRLNLPYVMIQHMIEAAGSGTKKITIPYGAHLTKVFKSADVNLKAEKKFNVCKTFSLKNTSHMKSTEVGEKRKREDSEGQGQTKKQAENVLPGQTDSAKGKEPASSNSIPFVDLETSLHFDSNIGIGVNPTPSEAAARTLEGFTKPLFSPLLHNTSFSSLLSNDFMRNILRTPSSALPRIPIPLYSSGSPLPSFPPNFASLGSFCSNQPPAPVNAPNPATGSEPKLKRTKLDKTVSKTKSDRAKILEGMMVQNNFLMHLTLEFQTLRDWLTTHVCPLINAPPPPVNPIPHIPEPQQPNEDSSSDGSSPTVSRA